jgi:hypothetical protein
MGNRSSILSVFPGHDKANIPWLTGLKVNIHDNAVIVKYQIAPLHPPDFADPESAFIEHYDHSPVPAGGAGIDDSHDLISREKVSGDFRHRVLVRDLESPDLLLGNLDDFIFDEPEIELFDDQDVIGYRILLEGPAFDVIAIFQGSDR